MWSRCRHHGVIRGTAGALVGFASAATLFNSLHNTDEQPVEESLKRISKTTTDTLKSMESKGVPPLPPENFFEEAIANSRNIIRKLKERSGAPGIVVGVSVDGKSVWQEGFGYSDVENRLPCTPNTVMRLGSTSKSITMAMVAQIWERGELDLDKAVHEYVPHFPKKTYSTPEGKETSTFISSRHLASHQSGIRHYKKKVDGDEENEEAETDEFKSNDKFKSVADSLKVFQDDSLRFEPGTDYLYSTHGWTLLSAVVEQVLQEPFTNVAQRFFALMGLKHTYLDENQSLIYNRSRFYVKNKKGELENSPHVDNSSKWAGGGFLSDVGDLLRFANIMLYAAGRSCNSDARHSRCLPGFLKSDTVNALWTPATLKRVTDSHAGWAAGLGWLVCPQRSYHGMCGSRPKKMVGHDGAAMGASSTLILRLPDVENKEHCNGVINEDDCMPRGVVVVMIANLSGVRLRRVAIEIAEMFDRSPLNLFSIYQYV